MECLDAGRLRAYRDEELAPEERSGRGAPSGDLAARCQQAWTLLERQSEESARMCFAVLAPGEGEISAAGRGVAGAGGKDGPFGPVCGRDCREVWLR